MKDGYDIIFNFYNDYKYLKSCIKNINNQTTVPNNLIFIDDGNKDRNLKKLIRKTLNKKIKLLFIKNSKNIGPEKSSENALKKISSKFFFLIAADDVIYKNFAEENVTILNKCPNAPFVFSNLVINNHINKKIYNINYYFLKKKNFYNKKEAKNFFEKHQFKIYHNTVVFNSKICQKNNLLKIIYGRRSDMLNLLYLASKFGFAYLNKNLSDFSFRKGQYGKIMSDDYLIKELLILKKYQHKFYKFFIETNLHFDLSIFSIPRLIKNNLIVAINLTWFIRSIKFFLWKKLRFIFPEKSLNILFKIFN
jgi:glycosyltransferase involved in cell wall biosynthesis